MCSGDYLNVQVHVCIGGKRVSDDIHTFEAGVQIVSGTPGRVFHMIQRLGRAWRFSQTCLHGVGLVGPVMDFHVFPPGEKMAVAIPLSSHTAMQSYKHPGPGNSEIKVWLKLGFEEHPHGVWPMLVHRSSPAAALYFTFCFLFASRQRHFSTRHIKMLVLDEADEMLNRRVLAGTVRA